MRLAPRVAICKDRPMKACADGPLAGVRILDFSRVLAGPWCTAMLGDAGAEVLKVESHAGDDQRHMGARRRSEHQFRTDQPQQRSLCLDLKSAAGRAIARDLAARSDVVVENFRPGVAARLGIDYTSLSERRPDLVYCSISGFGQEGPLAERASYDVIAQAMSGFMSVTGEPDRAPVFGGRFDRRYGLGSVRCLGDLRGAVSARTHGSRAPDRRRDVRFAVRPASDPRSPRLPAPARRPDDRVVVIRTRRRSGRSGRATASSSLPWPMTGCSGDSRR